MKKIVLLGRKIEQLCGAIWLDEAEAADIQVTDVPCREQGCLYLVFDREWASYLEQGVWCGEGVCSCKYSVEDAGQVPLWYLSQVYCHINNKPWTVWQDEQYVVREMSLEDLPAMYELYGKPGVAEYVEALYEYEEEYAFSKSYIETMYRFYGYGLWLLWSRQGRLLGRVGFSHREIDGEECVELGYIIDADYQHRGIGSYVCRRLLELGRDYWGFEDVYVCCEQDNKNSIALAHKLGFSDYGVCNEYVILRITDQRGNE